LFSPDFECEQLEHNLDSFQKIAHGAKDGGPIAQFDIPSFSLVDCIAQFGNSNLTTTSGTLMI
jgi:hypothetical protein